MQYMAWPDHGVPDDMSRFLSFTESVRRARAGMVEPAIVHCSAGIGRTGVLILMETAMCLIEANEPVYPLDIVKQMRDQRVMMIQTAVSKLSFRCLVQKMESKVILNNNLLLRFDKIVAIILKTFFFFSISEMNASLFKNNYQDFTSVLLALLNNLIESSITGGFKKEFYLIHSCGCLLLFLQSSMFGFM